MSARLICAVHAILIAEPHRLKKKRWQSIYMQIYLNEICFELFKMSSWTAYSLCCHRNESWNRSHIHLVLFFNIFLRRLLHTRYMWIYMFKKLPGNYAYKKHSAIILVCVLSFDGFHVLLLQATDTLSFLKIVNTRCLYLIYTFVFNLIISTVTYV